MNQTAAAIEAFAELTIRRLKGELPQAERAELEALEDQLRDEIDGARPAPRKIENPTAAPMGRASIPVKPAQVVVTRSTPGASEESSRIEPSVTPARPANVRRSNTPVPAPPPPAARPKEAAERLNLNSKDKSKLSEINAADLQVSHYTPSAAPPFMEDYYDEAMAPDPALAGLRPSVVRSLGDGPLPEVKTLFGVSRVVAVGPPEHETERHRRADPHRQHPVEFRQARRWLGGHQQQTPFEAIATGAVATSAMGAGVQQALSLGPSTTLRISGASSSTVYTSHGSASGPCTHTLSCTA